MRLVGRIVHVADCSTLDPVQEIVVRVTESPQGELPGNDWIPADVRVDAPVALEFLVSAAATQATKTHQLDVYLDGKPMRLTVTPCDSVVFTDRTYTVPQSAALDGRRVRAKLGLAPSRALWIADQPIGWHPLHVERHVNFRTEARNG